MIRNEVFTTELLFGLCPEMTLLGIYSDQGTKLIAQDKSVSYLVLDGVTKTPVLFEGEEFVSFMKFIGVEEIKVLLPRTHPRLYRGKDDEL
jgi:hypothetical protein